MGSCASCIHDSLSIRTLHPRKSYVKSLSDDTTTSSGPTTKRRGILEIPEETTEDESISDLELTDRSERTSEFRRPILKKWQTSLANIHTQKVHYVRKTTIADPLSKADLRKLAELFEFVKYAPEETIFNQDAIATHFYLIVKGEVAFQYDQPAEVREEEEEEEAPEIQFPLTLSLPGSGRPSIVDSTTNNPRHMPTKSAGNLNLPFQIQSPPSLDRSQSMRALRSPPNRSVTAKQGFFTPRSMQQAQEEGDLSLGKKTEIAISLASTLPSALPSQRYSKINPRARARTSISTDFTKTDLTSDLTNGTETPADTETKSHGNSVALLTVKKKGECFGDDALRIISTTSDESAEPIRRAVRAYATSPVMVLALPSSTFKSFVDSLHEDQGKNKLIEIVGNDIEQCLGQMPLFLSLPKSSLSLLATLFTWKFFDENKLIFHEGDVEPGGNSLYFLYQGSVNVEMQDEKGNDYTMKTLPAGSCFGELALFIQLPRTASIRAVTKCTLLQLPHAAFHNFLYLTPSLLEHFATQIEHYTVNLAYLLSNPYVLESFQKFCAVEYSSENVEFWLEAQKFRKTVFTDQTAMYKEALRLATKYICDSSPTQVNLKGPTHRAILSHFPAIYEIEQQVSQQMSQLSSHSSQSRLHSRESSTADCLRITNALFLEAEQEILQLMSTDSFSRFKASNLFRVCLEDIHKRTMKNSALSATSHTPSPSPTASPTPKQHPMSYNNEQVGSSTKNAKYTISLANDEDRASPPPQGNSPIVSATSLQNGRSLVSPGPNKGMNKDPSPRNAPELSPANMKGTSHARAPSFFRSFVAYKRVASINTQGLSTLKEISSSTTMAVDISPNTVSLNRRKPTLTPLSTHNSRTDRLSTSLSSFPVHSTSGEFHARRSSVDSSSNAKFGESLGGQTTHDAYLGAAPSLPGQVRNSITS